MIKQFLQPGLVVASLLIAAPALAAEKPTERKTDSAQTKLSPAQEKFAKDYQQAKQEFDSRQFEKSYASFGKLLEQAPANALVNFYYAASAAELGEYNEAIAGYERVLMLDPKSARVRLELARIYYAMGNTQMANNELEIALRTNLPSEVRASALAFQQRINQKPSKHSNSTAIILGMEYDSNVFNDIGSGTSFRLDGLGGLPLTGNSEEADFGLTTALVHNYGYKFNQKWSIQNQFLYYLKKNKEFSENNIDYKAVKVAPSYQLGKEKLTFPIELDWVAIDRKKYMENTAIGTELSHLLNEKQMFKLGWKARAMRYTTENQARDANAILFNFDYSEVLRKDPVILNFAATYENRSQKRNLGIDRVSFEEVLLKADIAKNFTYRWRGNYAMSLRSTSYKEVDPFFASSRSDKVVKFELGTAYRIDKNATWAMSASHAKHNSNQWVYDFDKTMFATNLIYQF